VAETASFLCRDEVEVRAKMKALGLVEPGQAEQDSRRPIKRSAQMSHQRNVDRGMLREWQTLDYSRCQSRSARFVITAAQGSPGDVPGLFLVGRHNR
jgi:hypothetical protein